MGGIQWYIKERVIVCSMALLTTHACIGMEYAQTPSSLLTFHERVRTLTTVLGQVPGAQIPFSTIKFISQRLVGISADRMQAFIDYTSSQSRQRSVSQHDLMHALYDLYPQTITFPDVQVFNCCVCPQEQLSSAIHAAFNAGVFCAAQLTYAPGFVDIATTEKEISALVNTVLPLEPERSMQELWPLISHIVVPSDKHCEMPAIFFITPSVIADSLQPQKHAYIAALRAVFHSKNQATTSKHAIVFISTDQGWSVCYCLKRSEDAAISCYIADAVGCKPLLQPVFLAVLDIISDHIMPDEYSYSLNESEPKTHEDSHLDAVIAALLLQETTDLTVQDIVRCAEISKHYAIPMADMIEYIETQIKNDPETQDETLSRVRLHQIVERIVAHGSLPVVNQEERMIIMKAFIERQEGRTVQLRTNTSLKIGRIEHAAYALRNAYYFSLFLLMNGGRQHIYSLLSDDIAHGIQTTIIDPILGAVARQDIALELVGSLIQNASNKSSLERTLKQYFVWDKFNASEKTLSLDQPDYYRAVRRMSLSHANLSATPNEIQQLVGDMVMYLGPIKILWNTSTMTVERHEKKYRKVKLPLPAQELNTRTMQLASAGLFKSMADKYKDAVIVTVIDEHAGDISVTIARARSECLGAMKDHTKAVGVFLIKDAQRRWYTALVFHPQQGPSEWYILDSQGVGRIEDSFLGYLQRTYERR